MIFRLDAAGRSAATLLQLGQKPPVELWLRLKRITELHNCNPDQDHRNAD